MQDKIEALNLFVRTAQTGSFSKAGQGLRKSQPSTSRTIAALERDLGVTLFSRSTRAVVLTDAGKEFLARVEPILAALDEAFHAVSGSKELRGILRVGMSSTFATREIIPRLPRFFGKHLGLKLDLLTSDQRQDLVLEGVDVALRLGKLEDSAATSRRLGRWRRGLLASPNYLKRMGIPKVPSDLRDHIFIAGPLGLAAGLNLQKGERKETIKTEGRVSVTVNEAAIAAAMAGLGIITTGMADTFDEIENGRLVLVLPDWKLSPIEVHAVYATGRTAKPAARVFTDFLIEDLRRTRSPDKL
jgi:DNA-binding transcriptional LysR family regulator